VSGTDVRAHTGLKFGPLVVALMVCGAFTALAGAALQRAEDVVRTLTPVCGPAGPSPAELRQGDFDDDRDATDSSDDDDDDDDDSPDMLKSLAPASAGDDSRTWSALHNEFERWFSTIVDGHSLRGPPRVVEELLAIDDTDVDDLLHVALTPITARTRGRKAYQPSSSRFDVPRALASRQRSLRAPPSQPFDRLLNFSIASLRPLRGLRLGRLR
jgi:hypothetical protein